MSSFLFTESAFEGPPINVFNHGGQKWDCANIDDIVNGIVQFLAQKEKIKGVEICNIGQKKPVDLGQFLEVVEEN